MLLKTVAVIPVFNEEDTIRKVVEGVKAYVSEIIVVDDGSSDKTRENAAKAGAKVISLPVNRGVAHAISIGLKETLKLNPDMIIQLDGDGQHNPDDIPSLLKPLTEGRADVVVGSRFLDGTDASDMPAVKRFGNKIFSNILSRMCRTKITDSQSGFRAYKREVAEELKLISFFSYTQEFLVKAYLGDYRITEVLIRVEKRVHGESRVVESVFYYTLYQLVTLFRVYRDYKPVKTFSMISALFFGLGVFLGLTSFLVCRHQMLLGLSGVLLIISALQIFFFGFLADMNRK
jgi:glycosyltransferase involved in cell wall biosynthesis